MSLTKNFGIMRDGGYDVAAARKACNAPTCDAPMDAAVLEFKSQIKEQAWLAAANRLEATIALPGCHV